MMRSPRSAIRSGFYKPLGGVARAERLNLWQAVYTAGLTFSRAGYIRSMATVLATWDEPENAESSLIHARLASVLRDLAEVDHVSIHPQTGIVEVAIRLPDDLTDTERDLRAARVLGKLLDLVSNLFAEDNLMLNRIRVLRAERSPPQSLPVRPRRGGGRH